MGLMGGFLKGWFGPRSSTSFDHFTIETHDFGDPIFLDPPNVIIILQWGILFKYIRKIEWNIFKQLYGYMELSGYSFLWGYSMGISLDNKRIQRGIAPLGGPPYL